MSGERHSRRGPAALVLASVLALLAFASFPVFAQAAGSGEIEYENPLPNAEGHHGHNTSGEEKIATSSQEKGGGVTAPSPGSSETAPPSGGSSVESPPSETVGEAGSGSGSRQGNPGESGVHRAEGGAGSPAQPHHAAKPADEGGGSSPLVPILIAIAVLAAISVGAVYLRRRRGEDRPPKAVSPRAG